MRARVFPVRPVPPAIPTVLVERATLIPIGAVVKTDVGHVKLKVALDNRRSVSRGVFVLAPHMWAPVGAEEVSCLR